MYTTRDDSLDYNLEALNDPDDRKLALGFANYGRLTYGGVSKFALKTEVQAPLGNLRPPADFERCVENTFTSKRAWN